MTYEGVPGGVGSWGKATRGERNISRGKSVGSIGDAGRAAGRRKAAEMFCCRARTWRYLYAFYF